MAKEKSFKALQQKLLKKRPHGFDVFTGADKRKLKQIAEDYRRYLSQVKTERDSTQFFLDMARANGFQTLPADAPADSPTGTGTYVMPYRNKVIGLARLGSRPLTEGLAIIATHQDSPRIDLKGNPLYEEQNLAMMKTHYFGGLRKHQWTSRPLAMHGVVVRGDGSVVSIHIGEEEEDPVFTIPDLLPHLAQKAQASKKLSEAIPAEKLNLVVGGIPIGGTEDKERIKLGVLNILHKRYKLVEEDFVSAEIELVPAGPARYVGLDRAFIGGYGHDDRASSFLAVQALLESKPGPRTRLVVCFDKEEIGSFGNTSAQGRFLQYAVEQLFLAQGISPREIDISRCLHNSKVLSADLAAGVNPNWQEVHDKHNAARMGCGVVIKKYTGSRGKLGASDASAEFVGEVRRIFNAARVPWQSAEMGKVDEGGGGTIAKFIAATGAEVLDVGPPVLAMHSPFELIHVGDLYAAFKAYKAFLGRI